MAEAEQTRARETRHREKPARKQDEDPVGKVYDSRLMRRLAGYVRPYWVQATIASLSVSLKSICDVAGPIMVMMAIDRYMAPNLKSQDATSALAHWLGTSSPLARVLPSGSLPGHYDAGRRCTLALLLAAYLFAFVQTYLMQWMGQKVMFDLRRDIFRHMQRMHIGFFDTNAVGRLVTRLTSDVDAINDMFTDGILAIVNDFFMLTIMAAVMLSINWWLALLAFCRAAADPDCDADVPRLGARELPPGAHRHCAHQQLYAGTHQRHERGAAVQPRRARLSGLRDGQPAAHDRVQRHDLCLRALLSGGGAAVVAWRLRWWCGAAASACWAMAR